MAKQKEIGDKGEEIAQTYLRQQGYEILETNWRFHHYEIDIIAKQGNELVIIEVKSRTGIAFEHPSEAVSPKKIRFIIEATEAYIFKTNSRCDTRFDVITVIFQDEEYELEHFKYAFYPTA